MSLSLVATAETCRVSGISLSSINLPAHLKFLESMAPSRTRHRYLLTYTRTYDYRG